MEVNTMLQHLITSCDSDTQNLILEKLAASLNDSEENFNIILQCGPMYDRLAKFLNRGQKIEKICKFLSALLYIDTDEGPTRRKLVHARAQHLLRNSGCLSAMCNLFAAHMMQEDTWRALCFSLAQACHGSERNQTLCSHLVPLCVKQCDSGNINVVIVLDVLLQNHYKNNKLFHVNNGMDIFNRIFLPDVPVLKLLHTVMENVPTEFINTIKSAETIFKELCYMSRMSGSCCQIARWATLIVYLRDEVLRKDRTFTNTGKTYHVEDKTMVTHLEDRSLDDGQDTRELYKNIRREVNNYQFHLFKNKQNIKANESFQTKYERLQRTQRGEANMKNKRSSMSQDPLKTKYKRVSGSQRDNRSSIKQSFQRQEAGHSFFHSKQTTTKQNSDLKDFDFNNTERNNFSRTLGLGNTGRRPSMTYEGQFRPSTVSTPKRVDKTYRTTSSLVNRSVNLERNNKNQNKHSMSLVTSAPKENGNINLSLGSKVKDIFNKSFSAVFKGLSSVFEKKSSDSTMNIVDKTHHSYSFNFSSCVPERDKVLAGNCSPEEQESTMKLVDSCSSCDNTLELRNKMLSDERLKQTVKKLKHGINLFGCDFKKISKTFWPNEKYMTPQLLHRLYRKLVCK